MNPERLTPHETAAERGILGGILRNPEALGSVRAIIPSDAFYHAHHQLLFRAMCDLEDSKRPADLVSLNAILRERKQDADVSVTTLVELFEGTATSASAEYHSHLVREAWIKRSLIHATNEMLRDAYDSIPAVELIAAYQSKISALGMLATGAKNRLITAGEMMASALERIDTRRETGGKLVGISSGYHGIDERMAGFRPGQMIVIGARPSIGKTSLALNIASRVAMRGEPVLFFSIEMPEAEIADRLLAMGSGVSMHKINSTNITEDEAKTLTATASPNGFGGCDFFLDDNGNQSVEQIAQVARRAVRKFGVRLIVIDYLQLITPANRRENRNSQVGEMSRAVKHIARDLGVAVICLAQLNRESESRGGEPKLSDLRDSGEIEQHADGVMLMHPNGDENLIDIIIAKNRNGPKGTVPLVVLRQLMKYENSCNW